MQLKPCPFCGGKVSLVHNIALEPDGIQCWTCHYVIRFSRIRHDPKDAFGVTAEKLAIAWNQRVEEKNGNII